MSRRERQRRRRRNRGSPLLRGLLLGGVLITCAVGLGVLGAVGWVVGVADSAPNLNQLSPHNPGQNSQVFGSDGSLLGYIQSVTLRTPMPDSTIPRSLKEATVAIEDRRFYQHGGVDYQGILRAGVRDLFGGGKTIQGGSTLTMQLVDNDYIPNIKNHNVKYKIIQAKLANELEKQQTKSQILTKYLNDVDYGTLGGQTAIGVGAASQLFFNRPVSRINLAQAALLAGLPQAPSQYNPFLAPNLATNRRHQVLQAMVQSHYITQAQADSADAEPLEVHRNNVYNRTPQDPYVFDYVHQALNAKYCPGKAPTVRCPRVDNGGLKVYTTIDPKRQQEAAQAIANNEGQPGDPAAAVVTVDPTNGHILAMQTSTTYAQSNFDYATQSLRQTGSAFKPFVLMTLIHNNDGDPDQTYYNSHELLPGWLPSFPTYHVQTAELSYQGDINVTKATIISDNTVFAQLDVDVGPKAVADTAHAMGITSPLDGIPAEGIGGLRVGVSPLQMADAYATLAGQGYHTPPTAISKVVFPNGSVDTSLGTPPRTQVFTDGEVAAATKVLQGVIQSGTGTAANIGCPAAGKTGTTSNYTDAWFVGYTPKLSTAVWVGYPKTTASMNDVNGLGPGYGGTLAAPIWHDYMTQATNGYCGGFPAPTTPFNGIAFTGKFAVAGNANSGQNNSGYGNGYGNGNGGSGSTTGNSYNNNSTSGNSGSGQSQSGGSAVAPGGATTGANGGNGTTGGNLGNGTTGGNGNGGNGNNGSPLPPSGTGGGQPPGTGGPGARKH